MSDTDVRTFRAASMQQALELVRRELGADAVILHTRELPQPRFLLWKRTTDRVEITAGLGINVRTPKALQQPMARAYVAASQVVATPRPVTSAPVESRNTPAARPLEQQPPMNGRVASPAPQLQPSPQSAWASPAAQQQQAAITNQLNSIQRMVEKLSQGSMARGEDIQSELFQLYTEMIENEVDDDLARELICTLKQEQHDATIDPESARRRLMQLVESGLRCAAPIQINRGRRRVIALVGPTGVGKTTTIAKLAANYRLRDGVRLGLVTVDTYRVAAVEQLRTYAEIIDLPMKVVTGPREMGRALDELQGLDLILIDTAGRSPRDELKIQELKTLLAEAHVDEVHLVLSMVSSSRTLEATAEKFAPAGTTNLVLTKLDEAVSMGPLMTVARKIPLPISYLTTGQDVPDDFEPAQANRMAKLILGKETLHPHR